jgi:hypothetical protein
MDNLLNKKMKKDRIIHHERPSIKHKMHVEFWLGSESQNRLTNLA